MGRMNLGQPSHSGNKEEPASADQPNAFGVAPGQVLQGSLAHPVPSRLDHNAYMRRALQQAAEAAAAGEVPIGAVVVYDPYNKETRTPLLPQPVVLAEGRNKRETAQNPAGHAEFLACLQAAEALQNWRLTGCTVYVTLEPCPMCAGLMHQSRVDRCVFGAFDAKAGAQGSVYQMNEDTRLNHTYPVEAGVLEEECAAQLKRFFASRRMPRT